MIALTWLMLLHVLQRSQHFPPAVPFRGTLIVSVEQTVVIAANLETDVEGFIFVSLSRVAPVAFHTPPVAFGFDHWQDRFVDQIKITLVDYCCSEMLCHLQEIAAHVGDFQVFDLEKTHKKAAVPFLKSSRFRLTCTFITFLHESFSWRCAVHTRLAVKRHSKAVFKRRIPGRLHYDAHAKLRRTLHR